MGIEVTITLAELDRARALLQDAHAKGYTASVAVFTVERAGRCIDECVAVSNGLLITAGTPDTNYGRHSSVEAFPTMAERSRPATCRHQLAGGQAVASVYCGKPAKKILLVPGRVPVVVCGVHARFWAVRGYTITELAT